MYFAARLANDLFSCYDKADLPLPLPLLKVKGQCTIAMDPKYPSNPYCLESNGIVSSDDIILIILGGPLLEPSFTVKTSDPFYIVKVAILSLTSPLTPYSY